MRTNLYKKLDIPDGGVVLLLGIVIAVALSPYAAGQEFGPITIPNLSKVPFIRWIGPVGLILFFAGFAKIWRITPNPSDIQTKEPTLRVRDIADFPVSEEDSLDGAKIFPKAEELLQKIVADRFDPDLIVGVSRGGAIVAAHISKKMRRKPAVPVIALWPRPHFRNGFNSFQLAAELRERVGAPPYKILVVDDIVRSGKSLNDAKMYASSMLNEDADIRTAAVIFSEIYDDPILPVYWMHETHDHRVRDSSGDLD